MSKILMLFNGVSGSLKVTHVQIVDTVTPIYKVTLHVTEGITLKKITVEFNTTTWKMMCF